MDENNNLTEPNDSQRNFILAIYILFALSVVFTSVTSAVGAILAYRKRDDVRGTIYETHIAYLLRTFIIALIGIILGIILSAIGFGLIIIVLVEIWYLFRVVVGIVKFAKKQPVTPTGYFM
ncbi:Predicted membrane protein [Phocoenobacter uteri]|uniref:Predicted membrane protein n=1 Tax=Phocoenobacter uteri TaxID=146806 RepID=A0A379C9C8_9PAST|nr:hypothetical protein [Phocoenobacter uteri]MDG6882695.1 hypothetical protein [Phocoenobacter uteri]SUB58861.1 Predicted membrane protein [Phocoenobacter uteri]